MPVERLILVAVIIVVAVVVAGIVQRRRPDAPTQSRNAVIPQQLDRDDFEGSDVDWLVVVFSSDTCDACEEVLVKARSLESDDTAVQDVSWQREKSLHERYAINTVPTMVIAGRDGAVGAGFVGIPPTNELWAAMASMRDAGAEAPGTE